MFTVENRSERPPVDRKSELFILCIYAFSKMNKLIYSFLYSVSYAHQSWTGGYISVCRWNLTMFTAENYDESPEITIMHFMHFLKMNKSIYSFVIQ